MDKQSQRVSSFIITKACNLVIKVTKGLSILFNVRIIQKRLNNFFGEIFYRIQLDLRVLQIVKKIKRLSFSSSFSNVQFLGSNMKEFYLIYQQIEKKQSMRFSHITQTLRGFSVIPEEIKVFNLKQDLLFFLLYQFFQKYLIIQMGNKHIEGLSTVVLKNWKPIYDGADVYQNYLTSQAVREIVIRIQNTTIFQNLKLRMKETNPYICRVVFYSHYIHNLYYVFIDDSRKKICVEYIFDWENQQKNIISAFMELAERYGPTRVCREMIGVDNNGQIKVWINPNTALCEVLCPCQTREMMLEDIKMILEQITNQYSFELMVKSLQLKNDKASKKIEIERKKKEKKKKRKKNYDQKNTSDFRISYSEIKKAYKKIKQSMQILENSICSIKDKKKTQVFKSKRNLSLSHRETFFSKISCSSIQNKPLFFKQTKNNKKFFVIPRKNENISTKTIKKYFPSPKNLFLSSRNLLSSKTKSKIKIRQMQRLSQAQERQIVEEKELTSLCSNLKQRRWHNKVLEKQLNRMIVFQEQKKQEESLKLKKDFEYYG